jgi:Ribonuclease G/E
MIIMKKLVPGILVVLAAFAFPACKEGNDNDGKTNILQDSVINVLPTWQAFHANIYDNRAGINIVVGDLTFYKASPADKAKKAEELGKMILRIYGKGNYLEKGTLIVTNDIRNKDEAPKDGITTPIPIAELKKAGY